MNQSLIHSVLAPPIPAFKVKCKELKPSGGKIFDLSQAVPAYPTFPKIREVLASALKRDEVSFYTDVPGLWELRTAIANRHPLVSDGDANRVLVTSGANHAMVTALSLLLNIGETVLLLEPYYFNYDMALPMLGLKPAYFKLDAEAGLQLDAPALITHLKKHTEIRALILITPNNPCGAKYPSAEILKLLQWTAAQKIEVIVDETYLKFDLDHLNHPELHRYLGRGLTLVGSFSKSYSLTGYRVGYLLSGSDSIEQALKIQDTFIICPSHLGQLAALAGIEHCDADVSREVGRMAEMTSVVQSKCQQLTHFRLVNVGSFFAYLQHPFRNLDSTQAALRLYQATGILGLPGEVFGHHQAAFIRISISNVAAMDLNAALDALVKFDSELSEDNL